MGSVRVVRLAARPRPHRLLPWVRVRHADRSGRLHPRHRRRNCVAPRPLQSRPVLGSRHGSWPRTRARLHHPCTRSGASPPQMATSLWGCRPSWSGRPRGPASEPQSRTALPNRTNHWGTLAPPAAGSASFRPHGRAV